MNQTWRYILTGLALVVGILAIWYFLNLVVYVLISAVLALIGRPVVELLGKIKIGRFRLPKSIRAVFTLLFMWAMIGLFLSIFIFFVSGEVSKLKDFDATKLEPLREPMEKLEAFITKASKYGDENTDNARDQSDEKMPNDRERIVIVNDQTDKALPISQERTNNADSLSGYIVQGPEESQDEKEGFIFEKYVKGKAINIFNLTFFENLIGSFATLIGNIFIAIFSITFITFFFLRDEKLFTNGILALVPDKHTEAFRHAMTSTRHLLVRYFVGILGQITGIFILLSLGLSLVGVGFKLSVLIALIAALFNVIPYVGPLIGIVIGILLGIAYHIEEDFYSELLPLAGWMLLIFIIVQLVDNYVFQPFIFSSSVKAHPLEIFLLLLIAASLAGITGMILAIPCYTVIRVFAKEFFNEFKVVKKLTKNID